MQMPKARGVSLGLVFALAAARPTTSAAADTASSCAALQKQVTDTEGEIAALKHQLVTLEQTLVKRKAARDAACVAPTAAKKTVKLPLATVAGWVNTAFEGSRLRLNNHGPAGFKPQDSFVQLGTRLGGVKIPFDLPEVSATLPVPLGTVKYYVNDVNSRSFQVALASGKFVAKVGFESDGPELVPGSGGALPLPNVDADNAELTVGLSPGLDSAGRPSYRAVDASLSAQYRCAQTGLDVCGVLQGTIKSFLDAQVQAAVRKSLDTPDVKSHVGAAVRAVLDSDAGHTALKAAGAGKITKILATRYEGDGLAVDYE